MSTASRKTQAAWRCFRFTAVGPRGIFLRIRANSETTAWQGQTSIDPKTLDQRQPCFILVLLGSVQFNKHLMMAATISIGFTNIAERPYEFIQLSPFYRCGG